MWESFKEIFPKTFLTVTFFLVIYGLCCGIRIMFRDEKKRRDDKIKGGDKKE